MAILHVLATRKVHAMKDNAKILAIGLLVGIILGFAVGFFAGYHKCEIKHRRPNDVQIQINRK